MPDQAGQSAGIWSDPNLMSIMLGMIGQAAMGQYGQQSWQSQLGGAATALGQSRKTALAAEEIGKKRETREAEWMDIIRSMYGGGEGRPTAFGSTTGVPQQAGISQPEGFGTFEEYSSPQRKEPSFLDTYLGGVAPQRKKPTLLDIYAVMRNW